MRDETCGRCGHAAFFHEPVPVGYVDRMTGPVTEFVHGTCRLILGTPYSTGWPCRCPSFIPDRLANLTRLIGFEARSVVGP